MDSQAKLIKYLTVHIGNEEPDEDAPLENSDLCELASLLIDMDRIAKERLKIRRTLTKFLKRLHSEYKITEMNKSGLHLYSSGWVKLGSET
ncbi:MAG: hypothetical protein KAS32_25610, partial [Candidatus Peribacteraceae bacterium]|nr:hypothetical protein [Candidatus Peribacteraceae bacterium]